jgi:hypothetical protein
MIWSKALQIVYTKKYELTWINSTGGKANIQPGEQGQKGTSATTCERRQAAELKP